MLAAAILFAAAFPLAYQTQWHYRGTVRGDWTRMTAARSVSTTMRVDSHVKVGRFEIAVVRGTPWEVSCFPRGSGRPPLTNVIVRDGSSYYHLQMQDPDPIMDVFHSEREVEEELQGNQPFLVMPMKGRTSIGCETHSAMDCWTVEERNGEFELTYRTNPDYEILDFQPGVGITRFRYNHNGSPCKIDLRLVR